MRLSTDDHDQLTALGELADILPPTSAVGPGGALSVGGCDLRELAARWVMAEEGLGADVAGPGAARHRRAGRYHAGAARRPS